MYNACPVPMLVVQVVLVDDDDDTGGGGGSGALLLHGRGARHSRLRFSGRPGGRTLSTYVVPGATITTTPGPHRGDRRDRQLRQDGGRWRFFATKPCIVYIHAQTYTGCPSNRFFACLQSLFSSRLMLMYISWEFLFIIPPTYLTCGRGKRATSGMPCMRTCLA